MQVSQNKVVSIDYTLTDDEGTVLDSSEGSEPLAYLHGVGNLIVGLEKSLEGRKVGDHFQVTIQPADAYGERDEALVQAIERSSFEGIEDLEIGMQFRVDSNHGEQVVTVIDIEDEEVTIDGNHELAGVTLHFDVHVRAIREATKDELAHGHAHGEGCCH